MSGMPSIEAHLDGIGPWLARPVPELDREVAGRVRAYLGDLRKHLVERHLQGATGREVNEANSDSIDRMVRRLFALAEEHLLAMRRDLEPGLCLIAVGGYARREMSIHSDVDILVLYEKGPTPYVVSIAERLQYWMWDAGLKVGCATRTIAETIELGQRDFTVRTAVLTARFLCGDGVFFQDFADAVRRNFIPDEKTFIEEQERAYRERHEKMGETLFLLQPNVKESAGGLRDYHTAYWIMRGIQPSSRDAEDLLHFGLLTHTEMQELQAALEFLWSVRNHLHWITDRRTDQMSFELQEKVAAKMGYEDATTEGEADELGVERFMRDYYRAARTIRTVAELVLEQCRARALGRDRDVHLREVEHGFRVTDEHLEIPHAAHLRRDPVRLLRAFEVAQSYGVPLSRMASRLVGENLHLIDESVRRAPEMRESFLAILNAEQRVMRTLMQMNEIGVLAALLPEWEHIVCRWQHVIYHTYTVDVHSIFLVEELRRLWRGKYDQDLPDMSRLIQEVDDRPVLFLGCLLHDIGKGFGGDHSNVGTERAKVCLERLGLSQERSDRVLFLVKHHLLMSHLAQRRDLSDPGLIFDFAQICGDRKNLRNLYLLTFADIRASSTDAWGEWKRLLLRELFERTSEFLEVGAGSRKRAAELIEERVEIRRDAARAELRGLGFDDLQSEAFFSDMPRRYFISHTPPQIARHAQVVFAYDTESGVATAFREMRGDFTEFILCTPDVHGLHSRVAGTLTALGTNILGSHVYTGRSGLALEVYRISNPEGGAEEREIWRQSLRENLAAVLAGEKTVEALLTQRRRRRGIPRLPSRQEPTVSVSNSESDFYTIADVVADDRSGLLHSLTEVFARHDLEIYISKASTVLDQVTDTFYLKTADAEKIYDEELLLQLQKDLLAAARGDAGA